MQEIIINVMNQFGYFGIFLLVVIENIFPPIPSEFILIFGGVLTTYTSMEVSLVVLYATLGSLVGAYILYIVGALLNKDRLLKIVNSKVGMCLSLKEEDVLKADSFFSNRGSRAVLFCRFVPIVRSLISIPAGMSSMPIIKFTIYTTLGTIIWNIVLVGIGSIVGNNWTSVVSFFGKYSFIVKLLLVIIICYFIFKLFYRKKVNE